jgi:hypothetical protein
MLTRRAVEVGRYYVNEERQRAREVLLVDHQTVHFNTYDLETGNLYGTPSRQCTRDEIIHWADREATVAETGSLHREEFDSLYRVEGRGPDRPRPDMDAWTSSLHEEARRTIFMK